MEKFGVFNEDWKWLLLESLCCSVAANKTTSGFSGFIRRNWPNVCYAFGRLGNLLCFSMIQWKDCLLHGCKSVFDLGTAALFIIIWSCFLSLTSMSCLLYILLSMVRLPTFPYKTSNSSFIALKVANRFPFFQFEEPKVPESFLEDDITEIKFCVNGEEDEHEQVNSCKS
ncbi:unnamed protein product [Lactuca virosa]|uniref:Uncharacterized protein n=1 Tax=Lactuca virosa TaxID=75947 RepID=A0AAU9PTP5_9ASTR|nr:unnamed protein product [Lactuca virosa]